MKSSPQAFVHRHAFRSGGISRKQAEALVSGVKFQQGEITVHTMGR